MLVRSTQKLILRWELFHKNISHLLATTFVAYCSSASWCKNVAQIKLISRGLEALAGDVSTEVEFKDNGTIGTANSTFVANTQTGIVNYVPASGTMAENTNYFVVLPTGKLASGLTLVFILTDGKSLQVKLNDAVNIERAKRYDLGNIALNASESKGRNTIE